ncbi:MAG TPA: NADH-quinone oxidoreductase subunit J [Planctomycetes bacterium]|nr:NADH-quinone oxidoreductase subunit J [Planctomycetota bacterium]
MAELLFYLLSLGAIGFGIGVIRTHMPLYSVLSLLGTFFCLAGIYLLAGFPFLAATQLLVYAGAIMVLFLFVIMLLNLGDRDELNRQTGVALSGPRLAAAGICAGLLGLAGLIAAGWGGKVTPTEAVAAGGVDRLNDIAEVLFGRYMLPFEAASLLLLATMVGVMSLAKRQRGEETEAGDTGWPWHKGVEQ